MCNDTRNENHCSQSRLKTNRGHGLFFYRSPINTLIIVFHYNLHESFGYFFSLWINTKCPKNLCLLFKRLTETLDLGTLLDWGFCTAALKTLALIWHYIFGEELYKKHNNMFQKISSFVSNLGINLVGLSFYSHNIQCMIQPTWAVTTRPDAILNGWDNFNFFLWVYVLLTKFWDHSWLLRQVSHYSW